MVRAHVQNDRFPYPALIFEELVRRFVAWRQFHVPPRQNPCSNPRICHIQQIPVPPGSRTGRNDPARPLRPESAGLPERINLPIAVNSMKADEHRATLTAEFVNKSDFQNRRQVLVTSRRSFKEESIRPILASRRNQVLKCWRVASPLISVLGVLKR